jgi:hypothetical protein
MLLSQLKKITQAYNILCRERSEFIEKGYTEEKSVLERQRYD